MFSSRSCTAGLRASRRVPSNFLAVLSVKVLIAGASGFIGSRLASAFTAEGHEVICGSRRGWATPGCTAGFRLDYTALPSPADWLRALTGCDVVINAVGILRPRGQQSFDALHRAGPCALFSACVATGVPRVIQISALGADADATAEYHRSKYAADRYLMDLPLDWAIVQPSLVYGTGGTSAKLFDGLASLPLVPLPGGGHQRIQPVHITDLVAAVLRLAESPAALRRVVPVVGAEPTTLREFLRELREAHGLPAARTLSIPSAVVRAAASVGQHLPGALLDPETLGMLERGNTGDTAAFTRLLGRVPRRVSEFILPTERETRHTAAALTWLLPVLRVGIAVLWLIAATVSAGPYPVEHSLALLRQIGLGATLAPVALASAILIDLAFGVMSLLPRRPRHLWTAQIVVVCAYTLIITWRLPELWLEPFGPVAKNIPILACLLLLSQLDRRR
jgi:uncharacterized protein YbjT (DUF2867 family)